MEKELKLFHKLLPIIVIPICFLFFASFGWSSFATITERSGLNGDTHMYYKLSKFQFASYTSFISLAGLLLIFLQVYFLVLKKPVLLTKTFWSFLFFIGLFIICEIYLQTRFVGKG